MTEKTEKKRYYIPVDADQRVRYSAAQKNYAMQEYLKGRAPDDIAMDAEMVDSKGRQCTGRSIRTWAARNQWDLTLENLRRNPVVIMEQISVALECVETAKTADERVKNADAALKLQTMLKGRNNALPAPTRRPTVQRQVDEALFEKTMAMFWYPYQREYLLDDSRFTCIFKSRQIGFSYAIAAKLLPKLVKGRNQLYVSASQDQSDIIVRYVREFAAMHDVEFDTDSDSKIRVGNAELRAFSTNFRTIQGFNGDVVLDEFAWLPKAQQKRVWNAIVPSITQKGGTVTVCSTAFQPNTLFYDIVTNRNGQYRQFKQIKLTIEDAINQGLEIPGGIEELRSLFDSESWSMLYMCEWLDEGDSLLNWELLQKAATGKEIRCYDGKVWSGVDIGRTADRTVVANVGMTETKGVYQLLHVDILKKNTTFEDQETWLHDVMRKYKVVRMQIDRTGIGMQLAERMRNAHDVIQGRYFSRDYKERIALNLLRLLEQDRLILPNNHVILSQLHAVKKKATSTGISFDAARDESGHADGFWAVALATDGLLNKENGDDDRRVILF